MCCGRGETQITCGDDRKKGKNDGKSAHAEDAEKSAKVAEVLAGLGALGFPLRVG